MALAGGTTVRGTNDKAASDPWLAIAGAINLDDLVVMAVCTDNLATATGASNTHVDAKVRDANVDKFTFTKIAEYTFSPSSAAGDGSTTSLWYAVATANIPSLNSDVPINFTAAITAKAMLLLSYTKDPTSTISVVASPDTVGATSDPTSRTLSGLTSREYLAIRAIGMETNSVAGLTSTATYAAPGFGSAQTSGGGAATNVAVRIEYKIATATSFTSDPTWIAADHSSIFAAIYENITPAVYMPKGKYVSQAVQRSVTRCKGILVPDHKLWRPKLWTPGEVSI